MGRNLEEVQAELEKEYMKDAEEKVTSLKWKNESLEERN